MRNLLFLLSLFIISTSQSNAQTDDPNGVIVVNGAHPCSLTGLGRRLSAGRDAEGTDRVSEWPIYPMKRETGLRDPFPEYRQRPNTLWMKEQAGRISSSYDRENKQLDLNLAGTVGFCETAPISETPRMLFQAPKANGLGNWALLGPQVYNYRYGNNFGDQVNEVIPFCNDMDFEETIHLKKGDFFNANGANFQINCSAPNCRAVSFDNEREAYSNDLNYLHQEILLIYRDPFTGEETSHYVSNAGGVDLVEDDSVTSNLDDIEGITSCDPEERATLQTQRAEASEAARRERSGQPIPYDPEHFFGEPYEILKPIQPGEVCSLGQIISRLERNRLSPEYLETANSSDAVDYQSIMRTNQLNNLGGYSLRCPSDNMDCGDQAHIMQLYDTDNTVTRNGANIEIRIQGEISNCSVPEDKMEESTLCHSNLYSTERRDIMYCSLDSLNEISKPEHFRTCELEEYSQNFSISYRNIQNANFSDFAVSCEAPLCKTHLFHSRPTALNRRGLDYTAHDAIVSRTNPRTGEVTHQLVLNARSIQVYEGDARDHVQEYYEGNSCEDLLSNEGFREDMQVVPTGEGLGDPPTEGRGPC